MCRRTSRGEPSPRRTRLSCSERPRTGGAGRAADLIVGNGATGKSTLARLLATRLGLRYIDRDALVWHEGWTILPRSERFPLFDTATREDGWTFDGHLRSGYADEEVVLER